MRPSVELHQRADFNAKGSKRHQTKITSCTTTQEKIKANTYRNKLVLKLPINAEQTKPTLQTSNISISHYILVSKTKHFMYRTAIVIKSSKICGLWNCQILCNAIPQAVLFLVLSYQRQVITQPKIKHTQSQSK